ncbi:cytochrome P450 [Nocardioides sp. cx-169]|uniref:cytochrome P450 n=1 Tax=Nocardioides sp. cx-169 TaxID=2899080 RepID=UPI001E549EFE|nr:cytochrome P450 [Nocardioides sp. cx-169]MCD4533643.1 cytochrome P450 [Nocardioides sp. cx-169]
MTDLNNVDFFNDPQLALDPYPLLEYLAANRPVWREPTHGVALVAGHQEAMEVLRDPATFSSSTIVSGPVPPFPVELTGDDITDIVAQYRDDLPMGDQIVAFDPPKHTAHRAILMGLITPKRLKENEEFIWRLTDRQLDVVLPLDRFELMTQYAHPYALLVVADLLGVPEEDHQLLLRKNGFSIDRVPGVGVGTSGEEDGSSHGGLAALYDYFIEAIEDRRREPRGDVLSGMANATFPDGSTPELIDCARIASNLFSAGQETTVRLLGTALKRIAEDGDLQTLLREKRELIPKYIEETLRFEGPIKGEFRLTLKTTQLAGVDLPAGTPVMLLNSGANRDARRFESPGEFLLDRANARNHLAFGHGVHTCPGAPLARSEVRITIERLFDRTDDIRISEADHGPEGNRRFDYMPTYMFRGLTKLFLELTPKA